MKKWRLVSGCLLILLGFWWFSAKPFAYFVEGNKIVKITMRHGGSGLFYETQDQELIGRFTQTMQKVKFRRTFTVGWWVGSSELKLYDLKGNLYTITENPHGAFDINGKRYKSTSNINEELRLFYKDFLTDKNVITGK